MDGYNRRKLIEPAVAPSADRDEEVVHRTKSPPSRINPPTESIKKIEKNIVKRKTQLFEGGNAAVNCESEGGNNVQEELESSPYRYIPHSQRDSPPSGTQQNKPTASTSLNQPDPSPHRYKPSSQNTSTQGVCSHQSKPTTQQRNVHINPKSPAYRPPSGEALSSSPYRYIPSSQNTDNSASPQGANKAPARSDVSVSRAIGEEAKSRVRLSKATPVVHDGGGSSWEKRKPPQRPSVPPSPVGVKDKPKYPYKPSVVEKAENNSSPQKVKSSNIARPTSPHRKPGGAARTSSPNRGVTSANTKARTNSPQNRPASSTGRATSPRTNTQQTSKSATISKKQPNLMVNIMQKTSEGRTSPKTPTTPPARPPPPPADKRVSTLIANKSKAFGPTATTTDKSLSSSPPDKSKIPIIPPNTKEKIAQDGGKHNKPPLSGKPNVKIKPSISFDGSSNPLLVSNIGDSQVSSQNYRQHPPAENEKQGKNNTLKPKVPKPTYHNKRNSGGSQENDNDTSLPATNSDMSSSALDYAKIDQEKKIADRRAKFEKAASVDSSDIFNNVVRPKVALVKSHERTYASIAENSANKSDIKDPLNSASPQDKNELGDKDSTNLSFSNVQKHKQVFEVGDTSSGNNNINQGAPPPKPPRTFAHDVYVKTKVEKKKEAKMEKRKKIGTSVPISPLVTAENSYEDINGDFSNIPGRQFMPRRDSAGESDNRFSKTREKQAHLYEEVVLKDSEAGIPNKLKPLIGKSQSHDTIADMKKTYTYEKLDDLPANYSHISASTSAAGPGSRGPPLPTSGRPEPPPRPGAVPVFTPIKTADKQPNDARWDRGYVKIASSNPRLKKQPIITKQAIANPGYDLKHECIPIKTIVMKDGSLKRYKSDECLYAESALLVSDTGQTMYYEEPLYHDPQDVLHDSGAYSYKVNQHGVAIDTAGYAMPGMGNQHNTDTKGRLRYKKQHHIKRTGTMSSAGTLTSNSSSGGVQRHLSKSSLDSMPSVREKLSVAYSVLRKRNEGDGQTEGAITATKNHHEDEDSDEDCDAEQQKRRLEYISTTKLRIRDSKYKSIYEKAMIKPPEQMQIQLLFDYALIVGLENIPDTKIYKPKILYSFPQQRKIIHAKDSTELPIIGSFCFPDAAVWRPVTHYRAENFSFVLTSSDGTRQYGYCKRFLPPDPTNNPNTNRLPEVYCIMTSLPAWSLYGKLLNALQEKRKISLHLAQELLSAAYGRPLPDPGQEVWIRSFGANDQNDTVIISRAADTRMETVSFECLIDHLSVEKLLCVFSALLLERKLLFVAQHLGTLTDCIHALIALLYPFTWQHTFIPILPGDLLDIVDAPTPYVLGTLASHYVQISTHDLSEVMVIDLDNDKILHEMGDEDKIVPKKLQKALKMALKGSVSKEEKNLLVSEAFLRMFVETVGHYTDYVNTQQDGTKEFHRESFVRAVTSKSIKMFLEWFSETQMFEIFITEKLQHPNNPEGLFEVRLDEYQDEMTNSQPTVKQNVRKAGKKVINFLVESGGRIKKVFV